ncbi:MAG: phosphoglycerate kinase [Pseudomonadota bacterium]
MTLDDLVPIETVDVSGKTVLVRADLNVPMQDGQVTDATRISRLVPGLLSLSDRGARVVVLSHFGRPKGVANRDLSLQPVAEALASIAERPVIFGPNCIGTEATAAVSKAGTGGLVVLENLRFHPGEEANDAAFAAQLAALGDVFVGDAFSCAHRAHASTAAIADLMPAYAGPLMMAEINALRSALDRPERPTVAVVGGAKVSTKLPVLTHLIGKVDHLVVGGGMANTFLLARGVPVGRSLAEPDLVATASEIAGTAERAGCTLHLPTDVAVAPEFKDGAPATLVSVDAVPADQMILDIGPQSVAAIQQVVDTCRTLLWNGPLGAFEVTPFNRGTFDLAAHVAKRTASGQLASIAGGGDTVAVLNAAGVTDQMTYVSTAGGAFLEWLEGRELPGVAALLHAPKAS